MIDLVESYTEQYSIIDEMSWMKGVTYYMPESIDELRNLLLDEWCGVGTGRVGADTETTGLNTRECEIVGISLSPMESVACYIPIAHKRHSNLPFGEVREVLNEYLRDKIVVFYNASFDASVWHREGLIADSRVEDAMIAVYLSNVSDKSFTEGLKAISKKILDIRMIEFAEAMGGGSWDEGYTFADTNPLFSGAYAAADADMALRVLWKLQDHWMKDEEPTLIWNVENQVIEVLEFMGKNTVLLDEEKIESYIQGALRDLAVRKALIYDMVGEEFDIASPQQVAKIVFGKLGIKSKLKTPKGKEATGKKALEAVADEHPVISEIEAYRVLEKNVMSYLMKLLAWCRDEGCEGRFHFNSVLAPSGRLSSDSGGPGSGFTPMNIQNITSAEAFEDYESKEIVNVEEFLRHLQIQDREFDLEPYLDHVRKNQKSKRKVAKRGKGDLDGSVVLD